MKDIIQSETFLVATQIVIGSVWIFHGLYSKVLNGIPRHQMIVARILGPEIAGPATKLIGTLEILLGAWTLAAWQPVACAVVQTAAIVAMNTLEIIRARELLISAAGMVLLNVGLVALVWHWALLRAGV